MLNYLMTYEGILFAISSISQFFQGFYFGRKNLLMFGLLSLVMLLSAVINIILRGDIFGNVAMIDIAVVVVYIVVLWGIGYVASDVLFILEDIEKEKANKINDNNNNGE